MRRARRASWTRCAHCKTIGPKRHRAPPARRRATLRQMWMAAEFEHRSRVAAGSRAAPHRHPSHPCRSEPVSARATRRSAQHLAERLDGVWLEDVRNVQEVARLSRAGPASPPTATRRSRDASTLGASLPCDRPAGRQRVVRACASVHARAHWPTQASLFPFPGSAPKKHPAAAAVEFGELLVPGERRCRVEAAMPADSRLRARGVHAIKNGLARFPPIAEIGGKQRLRKHNASARAVARNADLRIAPREERAAIPPLQQCHDATGAGRARDRDHPGRGCAIARSVQCSGKARYRGSSALAPASRRA